MRSASSSSVAPAPERVAKVVPDRAEQARVQLALRRQARPRAVAAERLRHRGDDADLAAPVHVPPALGDLAAIAGDRRLEGPLPRDSVDDLRRRNDLVESPAVRRADVHVLDEPEDVARVAGPARQRHDGVLVLAAAQDDVDLDRREPRLDGGVDALEHPRDREVDAVHPPEHVVVEGVERDGDPAQARVGKRASERLAARNRSSSGRGRRARRRRCAARRASRRGPAGRAGPSARRP